MNEPQEKITTAKRVYTVSKFNNASAWLASYQNLNPKTGQPWQAARSVLGCDGYWFRLTWQTPLEVGKGAMPETAQKAVTSGACFSSKQAAIDAIRRFDSDVK